MTERESFIASMRDNPADDTARLAFADWLDDRGEHDRAELIRLQVNRARLNPRLVLRVSGSFNFDRRIRPNGKNGVVLEFAGEFLPPVGVMLRPGVCFDAAEPVQWAPAEPARIIAPGCVVERLNPALRDVSVALAGTITGVPCLVRREAEVIDAAAGLLIAKLEANFAPPRSGFSRFGCAEEFNRPLFYDANTTLPGQLPSPAVLVRRGFVEHVRCSWELWLRWADWFRAEHPCEKVTLTTEPAPFLRRDDFERTLEVSIRGIRARWIFSEKEIMHSRQGEAVPVRSDVKKLLAREWPGTRFALPGEIHDWPDMRNFAPVPPPPATIN